MMAVAALLFMRSWDESLIPDALTLSSSISPTGSLRTGPPRSARLADMAPLSSRAAYRERTARRRAEGVAMTWFILIAVIGLVLALAALADMRSRRIRGHALTMRLPSRMARRSEARAMTSRRVAPADWEKYRARRPGEDIPRAD
jgi:hypothetical protein